MPRVLSSWIQGFEQYIAPKGSPKLFGRWTGIFTLAAAMERKCFVDTPKGRLFPNLYAILVGPAGAGKTVAADVAYEMMLHLEDHHIAPTSITKASMMDALERAERHIIRPQDTPSVIDFHSLTIMSNELGVLIPAYENDFINVLTDLYDGKRYSESRRTTKREFELRAPQFNILAATTPSYLNNLLPEGAWDQGFISRTMLIYSGRGESVDLFEEEALDKTLYGGLVHDLREIGAAYGRFKFAPQAIEQFRAWMKAREEPAPDHPKLQHYASRRQAHLLKLCMIASISSSDEFIVTEDHFVEAFDWLTEAEAYMPDIFRSMVMGGSSKIIDETWHFAFEWWKKKGGDKPIPQPLIYEFVAQRAPSHEVARLIENMERIGILEAVHVPGVGSSYKVKPRPVLR